LVLFGAFCGFSPRDKPMSTTTVQFGPMQRPRSISLAVFRFVTHHLDRQVSSLRLMTRIRDATGPQIHKIGIAVLALP